MLLRQGLQVAELIAMTKYIASVFSYTSTVSYDSSDLSIAAVIHIVHIQTHRLVLHTPM